MLRPVSDDKEVNDPRGEVQSYVCFIVDHTDAVSVPITGPGHAATEQQKRRPAHRQGGRGGEKKESSSSALFAED